MLLQVKQLRTSALLDCLGGGKMTWGNGPTGLGGWMGRSAGGWMFLWVSGSVMDRWMDEWVVGWVNGEGLDQFCMVEVTWKGGCMDGDE